MMRNRNMKAIAAGAPRPAADLQGLFDVLADLADVLFDFLDIINLFIETLLNWGDYLNGE